MDRFPLCWKGKTVGEMDVEREALYTWFSARGHLPESGLWCAWAVGEQGELRLGVLEPVGDQFRIRRKFSERMCRPLGRLRRCEVRPAGTAGKEETWIETNAPETLFCTPWLRQQLRGIKGAQTRMTQGLRWLALEYDRKKPFPIPGLFCLAEVRKISGRECVIYRFDQNEWPVWPEETE